MAFLTISLVGGGSDAAGPKTTVGDALSEADEFGIMDVGHGPVRGSQTPVIGSNSPSQVRAVGL